MSETQPAVDLSPYLAGLPSDITADYLRSLPPGKHAELVRKVESSVASLRDETIRAQSAIAAREQEMSAIAREAKEEHQVSTLEEANQKLEEAEARVLARWQDVAAAMTAKG